MKVRNVIRLIEDRGWVLVSTKGSHRQFKHPDIPGRVTVSGNLGHEIPKGTLRSILMQSGLKGRK